MTPLENILLWLLFGVISTIWAVFHFRPDGVSKGNGELYFVCIAPAFGPIVTLYMLVHTLYANI